MVAVVVAEDVAEDADEVECLTEAEVFRGGCANHLPCAPKIHESSDTRARRTRLRMDRVACHG